MLQRPFRDDFVSRWWAQAFSDDMRLSASEFANYNLFIGLFAVVPFLASFGRPERSSLVLALLFVMTAVTHVGGRVVLQFTRGHVASVIALQGAVLFVTLTAASLVTVWLALQPTLTSFRYAPFFLLNLFVYAGLELWFFGPWWVRLLHVRGVSVVIGVVSEVAIASALVWHLVHWFAHET